MTQPLGVWRVPASNGGDEPEPQRVEPGAIGLERIFDDWIARDATPHHGRRHHRRASSHRDQSGRLDLLAIDAHDHWLVIEVKPGSSTRPPYGRRSTTPRALPGSAARRSSPSWPRSSRTSASRTTSLRTCRSSSTARRKVSGATSPCCSSAPVSTRRWPRSVEYLARFDVPITVVSFQVFEMDDGQRLLIREKPEPVMEPTLGRKLTVDTIRDRAVEFGVGAQLDRFIAMSEAAGLAVQPQRASVRIAPMTNRTRYLMYAAPHRGGPRISTGARQFHEFFPHVSEKQASDALDVGGPDYAGQTLDDHLDRIERFLTEQVHPGEKPAAEAVWMGSGAMDSNLWQMVAAAAAVVAVWFAARHDNRQTRAATRTEFQQSIENAITPKLDILANSIAAVDARLGRVEMRLDGVETRLRTVEVDVSALKTDVGALKNDVAYLRDRQEERGGADRRRE